MSSKIFDENGCLNERLFLEVASSIYGRTPNKEDVSTYSVYQMSPFAKTEFGESWAAYPAYVAAVRTYKKLKFKRCQFTDENGNHHDFLLMRDDVNFNILLKYARDDLSFEAIYSEAMKYVYI